jgi:hypothetical protein
MRQRRNGLASRNDRDSMPTVTPYITCQSTKPQQSAIPNDTIVHIASITRPHKPMLGLAIFFKCRHVTQREMYRIRSDPAELRSPFLILWSGASLGILPLKEVHWSGSRKRIGCVCFQCRIETLGLGGHMKAVKWDTAFALGDNFLSSAFLGGRLGQNSCRVCLSVGWASCPRWGDCLYPWARPL